MRRESGYCSRVSCLWLVWFSQNFTCLISVLNSESVTSSILSASGCYAVASKKVVEMIDKTRGPCFFTLEFSPWPPPLGFCRLLPKEWQWRVRRKIHFARCWVPQREALLRILLELEHRATGWTFQHLLHHQALTGQACWRIGRRVFFLLWYC